MNYAILSMGPEGDLYLNEGRDTEGNLIAWVSSSVLQQLNFFDEDKAVFSYEEDSERAATLLRWQLEDRGYELGEPQKFLQRVTELCTPGPGYTDDPGHWIIRIRIAV